MQEAPWIMASEFSPILNNLPKGLGWTNAIGKSLPNHLRIYPQALTDPKSIYSSRVLKLPLH
jgi:hypothetical protein